MEQLMKELLRIIWSGQQPKFRANGEVNGKPAYYNPVTKQSLTADSNGKYELHDW